MIYAVPAMVRSRPTCGIVTTDVTEKRQSKSAQMMNKLVQVVTCESEARSRVFYSDLNKHSTSESNQRNYVHLIPGLTETVSIDVHG